MSNEWGADNAVEEVESGEELVDTPEVDKDSSDRVGLELGFYPLRIREGSFNYSCIAVRVILTELLGVRGR